MCFYQECELTVQIVLELLNAFEESIVLTFSLEFINEKKQQIWYWNSEDS